MTVALDSQPIQDRRYKLNEHILCVYVVGPDGTRHLLTKVVRMEPFRVELEAGPPSHDSNGHTLPLS